MGMHSEVQVQLLRNAKVSVPVLEFRAARATEMRADLNCILKMVYRMVGFVVEFLTINVNELSGMGITFRAFICSRTSRMEIWDCGHRRKIPVTGEGFRIHKCMRNDVPWSKMDPGNLCIGRCQPATHCPLRWHGVMSAERQPPMYYFILPVF